ncbi:MAG: nucleoside hydrolase [Peptoniphilaceae bacterium]|nr:nucleoside hydrolase [Peptoniphilaceae bacterium]MDY6018058.1 nucleoside hydrolase [Anaerococcus sp.]
MQREKPFVYIDTNFSLGERLMLKLAFNTFDFEIVGISTVSSAMDAKVAAENIVGMSEIEDLYLSVCQGENVNLKGQEILLKEKNEKIFANVKDYVEDENAIKNLYDLAKDCGRLDIITTSPLTNIAKALREYDDLEDYISHIFILGASFSAGDVTSDAEYNFFTDPIAADEIFNRGIDIFLLPIDLSKSVVLNDAMLDQLKDSDQVTKTILDDYRKSPEELRDLGPALLLYLVLTPEAFIFEEDGLSVNTKEQRGKVYRTNKRKKVYIANRVNENSFFEFIKATL